MASGCGEPRRAAPGAYGSADGLLADLDLVMGSLLAHGGKRVAEGALLDLRRRVETFGFYLAELEIRQHAQRHAAAAAELLGLAGVPGYLAMDESERMRVLEEQLGRPEPFGFPSEALSGPTREVVDTFVAMADVQRLSGPQAAHRRASSR